MADQLRSDLNRHLELRQQESGPQQTEGEFEKTLTLVRQFLLIPKILSGREILISAKVFRPYPASRALCKAFNLQYGATIGSRIKVVEPDAKLMTDFTEVYATGDRVTHLLSLARAEGPQGLYARLQFAEDDITTTSGRFFGHTHYYEPDPEPYDSNEQYLPAEGKVILLFSKAGAPKD